MLREGPETPTKWKSKSVSIPRDAFALKRIQNEGYIKGADKHTNIEIQNEHSTKYKIHMYKADSGGPTCAVSLIVLSSTRNLDSSISSIRLEENNN